MTPGQPFIFGNTYDGSQLFPGEIAFDDDIDPHGGGLVESEIYKVPLAYCADILRVPKIFLTLSPNLIRYRLVTKHASDGNSSCDDSGLMTDD